MKRSACLVGLAAILLGFVGLANAGHTYHYKGTIKGSKIPALRKILQTLQPISSLRGSSSRVDTFIFRSSGKRWWRAELGAKNQYRITEFGNKRIRHFVITPRGIERVEVSGRDGSGFRTYTQGTYFGLTNTAAKELFPLPSKPIGNPLVQLGMFK